MRRPSRSSGDLIADRRYAYALELQKAGDITAAIELFEQAVERAPQWPAGWLALARARRDGFDQAGAIAAFRQCLHLDPADEGGASLDLARLDAAVTVDAAPAAYVAALFDAYAPDFDAALVERLGYSAPREIAARLKALAPGPKRFARALDLGCGTGLAGEALRLDVAYLEGVDLSEGMMALARSKGVYDALHRADILAYLASPGEPFDLILAADVFSYVGDLSPLMKALARRLAPGGYCAFSVEKGGPQDWTIRESLRFAHSEAYLRALGEASGLAVASIDGAILRRDRGADIEGYIVVLKAPEAPGLSAMRMPDGDAAAPSPAPSETPAVH